MEEKKKFEKPQMEAIKLDSKISILAGSYIYCTEDTACPSYCIVFS